MAGGRVANLYEIAQEMANEIRDDTSVSPSNLAETLASMEPMVREIDQSNKKIIKLLERLIDPSNRPPLYSINEELKRFLEAYVIRKLSAIDEVAEDDPKNKLQLLLNRLNSELENERSRAAEKTKLVFKSIDLTLSGLYKQLINDRLVDPARHLPLVKKVQVLVQFHRGGHGIDIPQRLSDLEMKLREHLAEEPEQKLDLRTQELQRIDEREHDGRAKQQQLDALLKIIPSVTVLLAVLDKNEIISSIVLEKPIHSLILILTIIVLFMAYIHQYWTTTQRTSGVLYHVFLSVKGGDILKTHADPLYRALKNNNLRTFYYQDIEDLGRMIADKLNDGLQNSWSAIILFSREYASSEWCLFELAYIINRNQITPNHYPIIPIRCDDLSYRDLALEDGSIYLEALQNHINRHGQKQVHEWENALRNASVRVARNAPGYVKQFPPLIF